MLKNGENMNIYEKIYAFSASAGAFEGFVYPQKKDLDPNELTNWVDNLVAGYHALPPDVRDAIQLSLDQTIGRALHALRVIVDDQDELIKNYAYEAGHL